MKPLNKSFVDNSLSLMVRAGDTEYGYPREYDAMKNMVYIGTPVQHERMIQQPLFEAVKDEASLVLTDFAHPGSLYESTVRMLREEGYRIAVLDLIPMGSEERKKLPFEEEEKIQWDICGDHNTDIYNICQQMLGMREGECSAEQQYAYDLLLPAASYLNRCFEPAGGSFLRQLTDRAMSPDILSILEEEYERCTRDQKLKSRTVCWQMFQDAAPDIRERSLRYLRRVMKQYSDRLYYLDAFESGFHLDELLDKKTVLYIEMEPEHAPECAGFIISRLFAKMDAMAWNVPEGSRKLLSFIQYTQGIESVRLYGGIDGVFSKSTMKQAGFAFCFLADSIENMEKCSGVESSLQFQCGTILVDLPLGRDDYYTLCGKYNPMFRSKLHKLKNSKDRILIAETGFRNPAFLFRPEVE